MEISELKLPYSFDESEPDLLKKVALPESKIQNLLHLKNLEEPRLHPNGYPSKTKQEHEKDVEIKLRSVYENILRGFYDAISPKSAEVILNYGFLAGGCFKSTVLRENVNDYDLFFTDREAVDYFIDLFNQTFITEDPLSFAGLTGSKFSINLISITENAITVFLAGNGASFKVQLITKYFGNPEDVTSKFDFEHCRAYFKWDQPMVINYDLISQRRLVFNEKCSNPLSSIMRLHKFLSQGWSVKKEEILKIGKAVKSVDFSNEKDLADSIFGFY
jgi:hypothetical protein